MDEWGLFDPAKCGFAALLDKLDENLQILNAYGSAATLATGTALCTLGVAGLGSWTLWHTPVPYFGMALPVWPSVALAMLGSGAAVLAGALVCARLVIVRG